MIQPARYLEYTRGLGRAPGFPPPHGLVLCYQRSLLNHVLAQHKTIQPANSWGVHLLEETENRVGILGHFGIGAPAAVVVLEEWIALGVKNFLSIGTAGGLQPDMEIGDLVVCDRAVRDEGISHHYLEPAKYAHASPRLTALLTQTLAEHGLAHSVGTSWTIDAPYRETHAEVRRYQAEGVVAVEMEAAALFAVAQYRNVDLGAMFTISDSLAGLEWHPEFHSDRTKQGLETLHQVCLRCFER